MSTPLTRKGTKSFLRGSLNPNNLMASYEYKRDFFREHPNYFDPDGIVLFCGMQGQGKTLSAVQYIKKLMGVYEKCVVVSNVVFNGVDEDRLIMFNGIEDLLDKFGNISNDYDGVIYFIDEISQLFSSLESKWIPPQVLVEIAQQRKQRKHIVGTTQVYLRVAKPFREQVKYLVQCKCIFGLVQINTLIDGVTVKEKPDGGMAGTSIRRYFWFHTPELYESYDTYAKIERGEYRAADNRTFRTNG